jgi:nitrous oxide reductase accessory protein NosL
MKGKKRPRPVEMTHEAVCPFCGALLAFAHEPAGIVHGMPLCEEMRAAPDATTFLDRAAARVLMLEAGGARGKA